MCLVWHAEYCDTPTSCRVKWCDKSVAQAAFNTDRSSIQYRWWCICEPNLWSGGGIQSLAAAQRQVWGTIKWGGSLRTILGVCGNWYNGVLWGSHSDLLTFPLRLRWSFFQRAPLCLHKAFHYTYVDHCDLQRNKHDSTGHAMTLCPRLHVMPVFAMACRVVGFYNRVVYLDSIDNRYLYGYDAGADAKARISRDSVKE